MARPDRRDGPSPPSRRRQHPNHVVGNGVAGDLPEVQQNEPTCGARPPITETTGRSFPREAGLPRAQPQVDDPLQAAVEVVREVMHDEMRDSVVILETADASRSEL